MARLDRIIRALRTDASLSPEESRWLVELLEPLPQVRKGSSRLTARALAGEPETAAIIELLLSRYGDSGEELKAAIERLVALYGNLESREPLSDDNRTVALDVARRLRARFIGTRTICRPMLRDEHP